MSLVLARAHSSNELKLTCRAACNTLMPRETSMAAPGQVQRLVRPVPDLPFDSQSFCHLMMKCISRR